MKACMMFKVFVVLVVLMLAGSAPAAFWTYWTGQTSNNWGTGSNWDLYYGGAWIQGDLPDLNCNTNIVSGNVVLSSGSVVVKDFIMFTNHADLYPTEPGYHTSNESWGDISLTINSGASLHSNETIDLGYYGGAGKVIVNVDAGATLSSTGTFLYPPRAGAHQVNIAGTVEGGDFGLGGSTIVNFSATTGKLIVHSAYNYSPWFGTLILDRGFGVGDPGWGTTYGIVGTWDSGSGTTTYQSIPEPASMVLLAIGGLALRRNKK